MSNALAGPPRNMYERVGRIVGDFFVNCMKNNNTRSEFTQYTVEQLFN